MRFLGLQLDPLSMERLYVVHARENGRAMLSRGLPDQDFNCFDTGESLSIASNFKFFMRPLSSGDYDGLF